MAMSKLGICYSTVLDRFAGAARMDLIVPNPPYEKDVEDEEDFRADADDGTF
jgi:tRNA1(Val) A37 N6-methylase TrmN6